MSNMLRPSFSVEISEVLPQHISASLIYTYSYNSQSICTITLSTSFKHSFEISVPAIHQHVGVVNSSNLSPPRKSWSFYSPYVHCNDSRS